MAKPTLDLLPARRRILIAMHAALCAGESGLFTAPELKGLLGLTTGVTSAALDELVAMKEVAFDEARQDVLLGAVAAKMNPGSMLPWYRITGEGIRIVQHMADDVYESHLAATEPVVANEALDSWQPLPIDRQSRDFEKMVAATELAIDEIEGSNGYAASDPEERTSIVLAIKGTLATVRGGSPTLTLVRAGMLAPLRFVASKFTGAALGEAAKLAVAAIFKWLAGL